MNNNTSKTSCKQGFTLIELLVVVLIIGILAAVAVPQYQKAVYKSRAAEAVTMLQAITQAREVYYLANGEFTKDITKLDVEVPPTLVFEADADIPEKNYGYRCKNNYCEASSKNPSLPMLEFYRSTTNQGVQWCFYNDSKNSIAKSVCQSMGILDTKSVYNKYDWFKDKYFILN